MKSSLKRSLVAEFLGTLFLVATVVGSGLMAEGLAQGNDAIALLGNTIATGAILVVLILVFGPVSGAHFNPAVTVVFWQRGEIKGATALLYILTQCAGGLAGTLVAHAMFDLTLIQEGVKVRSGVSQWFAEGVATFGLLMAILGTLKAAPKLVPYAVGLYITAGYWFTASTSFANPAVTLARGFTDSFSGIRPIDMPAFWVAQIVGGLLASYLFAWLLAGTSEDEPAKEQDD